MERNIKRIGLANLFVLLLMGVVAFAASRYTATLAGVVGTVFLALGTLVAAASWFQMRLEENERLEKLEFDELARSKGGGLFEITDSEIFPAQRTREQFERFFIPGFTIVLFLFQAGAALLLWRWVSGSVLTPVRFPLMAAGFFFGFFLVLFIVGKYSANLARYEKQRLVRPGAGYLLLGAYLCFLITAGVTAVLGEFPRVDAFLARGLVALLALIAVETLANLILEIYRPRVKGREVRPLYESRLVGLLSQPEGLVTTMAQAIDYQFGFKVSDTWFYRFLERWLGWLVLTQAAVLWISTGVIIIEPSEQALIERLGAPVASRNPLGPGIHFKAPWPLAKVYRFPTGEILTFHIGFKDDDHNQHDSKLMLWTVAHFKEEYNLLVASRDTGAGATNQAGDAAVPVSLLSAGIPVQYRITNTVAWAYNYADAGTLLPEMATREVVRYLVGVDLLDVMSTDRDKAAATLRKNIQARADELKLGVEILFVGLQDIHPPVKVAEAFEAVNGAQQEVEAKILKAQGEATKTVLLAQAEALELERGAETYAMRRTTGAEATAGRFADQIAAYQAAPEIYSQRLYLQTLVRGSAEARIYLVATTNTQDVIQLNLEDQVRRDLRNIAIPPSTKK